MGRDEIQIAAAPAAAHQRLTPYLDALRAYALQEPTRLNVPGHQGGRGADPGLVELIGERCLAVDVPPLLPGIDSGEDEPLALATRLAARAWGARRTWFLTNGASQGNQVALLAAATLGPTVALQRNAHSSTIDGLVLAGLMPVFLTPELDRDLGIAHTVSPETLAWALREHGGVVAAFVTSPTYFGAVADIGGLARVAHAHGIPLVVDEAWGGHLGFHPSLPRSALTSGADLVISSTHKMVGSLTQSAMLHLGDGEHACRLEPAVVRCLRIVESTSSSSLLLASLDGARRRAAMRGRALLDRLLTEAGKLAERIDATDGFAVANARIARWPGVVAHDPLRIVVDVRASGTTGYAVGDRLRREHGIDLEVRTRDAVVAVLGLGDGEGLASAGRALAGALAALAPTRGAPPPAPPATPAWGELAMAPRQAFFACHEVVALEHAVGRVAADTLAAYPPGIPNVVPGERVTPELAPFLRGVVAQGGFVRGAHTPNVDRMRVVARGWDA